MTSRERAIEYLKKSYGEDFFFHITMKEFVEKAIDDFKRFNQGSLSFTMTALRHAGYDYPEGFIRIIAEIIEEEQA